MTYEDLLNIIQQFKEDLNVLGVIDTINITNSTDENPGVTMEMEIKFTQNCYAQTLHNRIIKTKDKKSSLSENMIIYRIDTGFLMDNKFLLQYAKKNAEKMKKALTEQKNRQELSAFLIPWTKILIDLGILVNTHFQHLHVERNEQQELLTNLSVQLSSQQATMAVANVLCEENKSIVAYDLEQCTVQFSYNLSDVQKNPFCQNLKSSLEAQLFIYKELKNALEEQSLIDEVLKNTLQNAAPQPEVTSQRTSRKFESLFTLFRKVNFCQINTFQEPPSPLLLPNIDNLHQLMHRARWIKNSSIEDCIDGKMAITFEFSTKIHAQALYKTMKMPEFNRFFPAACSIDLVINTDIPHITYYCTSDDTTHVFYQDSLDAQAIEDFEAALMDSMKELLKPVVTPLSVSPTSITQSIAKVPCALFAVVASNNSLITMNDQNIIAINSLTYSNAPSK